MVLAPKDSKSSLMESGFSVVLLAKPVALAGIYFYYAVPCMFHIKATLVQFHLSGSVRKLWP